MALERLDHFTIRTSPAALEATRAFYVEVLGLAAGARPPFTFPGYWLYCGDRPVVHLAGTLGSPDERPDDTGKLDHVAFQASGLGGMLAKLKALGIAYDQRTVPLLELHQVFLTDPNGLKIELNYAAGEAEGAER
jgi:catechol 2,3-dioxygenase-like lactoylglutathione lyase family enzyme